MLKNRLLGLLSMIGLNAAFTSNMQVSGTSFRPATPARHRRRYAAPSYGLPHGHPGAKLARKAMKGTVGKATLR